MGKVKISIIVPIYNVEKFLKKCIDSILEQDFEDFELILINDGSTDNSLEIAKKYCDERIVLIDKKNEGLSATRNLGIKRAKGEYILHIDSDDWIAPNYLKTVYSEALSQEAEIVITDYYINYSDKVAIYKKIGRGIWKNDNINCTKKIINSEINPNVWNKLIKRSLYTDNNIYHPVNIQYGEDLAVTPRLMYYAKKIIKINKAFVHYRQNPMSITKTAKLNSIFELKDCLDILKKFFSDKEFDIKGLWVNFIPFILGNKDIFKDIKYKNIIREYLEVCQEISLENIYSKRYKIYIQILKNINSIFMLKILGIIERGLLRLKYFIIKKW